MNLNLSSQIVLNQVAEEFYNPKTAVERSEITRFEKLPTDIYPKVEDGAKAIADAIEQEIKAKKQEGKQLILGLGTGQSLTPIFDELIRRHEEGLSFDNVTVVNAYEYFPLKPGSSISSLAAAQEPSARQARHPCGQHSVPRRFRSSERCAKDLPRL
jgi:glucosamine-6-phosphate deaminase